MTQRVQANFLLIDGVLCPGRLAAFYQSGQALEIRPLYLGSRWEALKDLGPVLVKPNANSSLISDWFKDPIAQKSSTLLSSGQSLDKVANHLCHFVSPPDVRGGNGLLRFSDPMVAHYWLSSFSAEQRDQRFGPIDQWWVRQPTHSWQEPHETSWQVFSRTEPVSPWNAQHAKLCQVQLAALDDAHRWKFEEDAYQWLNERNAHAFKGMDSQQISEWLKGVIDAGLEWGLAGEKTLIIWVEACADLGHDFTTRPNNPYLIWINLNLENARLAPEPRIKAFNHYRHSHKDAAHG